MLSVRDCSGSERLLARFFGRVRVLAISHCNVERLTMHAALHRTFAAQVLAVLLLQNHFFIAHRFKVPKNIESTCLIMAAPAATLDDGYARLGQLVSDLNVKTACTPFPTLAMSFGLHTTN